VIVTFYSYKGGVGRSMAMANVADILAQSGARVLMIDFDLEAPGLEQYFQIPQESARAHEGLLDLLLAFKESMAVGGAGAKGDFRDLGRFILAVYQKLPSGGSLDLMPAGRREGADLERYVTGVRAFDWQDFYFNWEGELFFEWLRDELTKNRYDVVLVDSRTGVTEMGGICSYQLADHMVIFCGANKQNVRGTVNVAEDFTSARVMARRQDRALGIVVVPARIEQREGPFLEQFLVDFDGRFGEYYPRALRDAEVGVRDLMIPYQPEYAFEERVVTDPVDGAKRGAIGSAFRALARAVTLLAPPGSRIAALSGHNGVDRAPTAEYDVTTRFGGFDVHLAGSATDRGRLDALRHQLEGEGLQVFLDSMEPVPPEEWRRRSEQTLFHSKVLLVLANDLTPAQREGLAGLVRANQGAKNRPVALVVLADESDPAIARQLGIPPEHAHHLPGWPTNASELPALLADLRDLAASRPDTGSRAALPAPSAGSRSAPAPTQKPAPAAAAGPRASPTTATGQPFRGAETFREDSAGFFFGREHLVGDIVAALQGDQRVCLVGPTRCGKTSAVMAGVFPILRAKIPGRFLERLELGPNCLARLRETLQRLPAASAATWHLLFLDDFELVADLSREERAELYATLVRLAQERTDLAVLIGAREDRLGGLTDPPVEVGLGTPKTIRIPDFTAAELRAAIERPAERSGLAYEPGLVDRIMADAGLQSSVLPLLQQTLQRLWEIRRDGWLTNAGYERIGGVGTVGGEICDTTLRGCSAGDEILDRIFGRLVTIEETAPPVTDEMVAAGHPESGATARPLRRRLRVPVREIVPEGADAAAYDAAIDYLTTNGLLVGSANELAEPCVELVHDAALDRSELLKGRLVRLLGRDRDFLLWRQQLAASLQKWRASGRREGTLNGDAWATAKRWADRRAADLNADERQFIARSSQVLLRRRAGVIVAGALLLGFIFFNQRRQQSVDSATTAVAAADELASRHQWQAAIAGYTSAADRYRFRDSLLVRRGRAYDAIADYKHAIADFSAALEITPDALDPLVARASSELKAGDSRGALRDFNAVIQKDATNADAYFGRAVARTRLKGSADSSLADLSRAFAVDSTRLDVLFERGSLNQRLGRSADAVHDFRKVAALATNPDDREAAQARLTQLLPRAAPSLPPVPVRSTARTTVYIQYVDPHDEKIVALIRSEIAGAGAFDVPAPELVARGRTVGDVRFVQGNDRYVKDVLVAAERALAKNGYRVRLQPRPMDQKQFPNFTPGRIEVWLPSLSQSLFTQQAY
jgi:tetratricopeptide (TPR) repeat protein/cellulose biosynthesis protein BcsQ